MLHKTPARLFRLSLLFTLTVNALTVNAQDKRTPDKEMDQVQAMIEQSKKMPNSSRSLAANQVTRTIQT